MTDRTESELVLPLPPDRIHRVVYFGTPGLAVPPLTALLDAGVEVPLVVSRADAKRGRGGGLQPSPVKAAALEHGLEVTTDPMDALDVEADLGVVVAYGRLLRRPLLDRLPLVNLHFSLLPRWRGAAPVERALLAGDAETGVCLMAIEEGLDTGGVYRRAVTPIAEDDTLTSLRGRLVELGVGLLTDAVREGFGSPEPQVGEPVHAEKISKDELRLDPDRGVADVDRRIRLGGAWAEFRGARMKIWATTPGPEARPATIEVGTVDEDLVWWCSDGGRRLVTVQPENKPRMDASAWANGARPGPEDRLR